MKQKTLSLLENDVMNVVWRLEKCSVRDILPNLANKNYAYTTIATILNRLHKKGLVSKKLEKSSYVYSARVTKESYTKNVAQSFLKKFIGSFGNVAVSSFAESIDDLPEDKRKYFLKLLKNNEKNK
jgi:predicted transcriptional regulator